MTSRSLRPVSATPCTIACVHCCHVAVL